jgi:hypothetical protein
MLIFERFSRRNRPVSAVRGFFGTSWRHDRLCKRKFLQVHAQLIFRCRANPRFRVHRAAQMIVEIRPLGHPHKEMPKLKGVFSRRL